MKNIFKAYNKKTSAEVTDLWQTAEITFDTNILIGLYNNSSYITKLFFDVLERIKERSFLTFQVGLEFHKKRYNVLIDVKRQFKSTLTEIEKYESELLNNKYSYIFSPMSKNAIANDFKSIKELIEKRIQEIASLEENDIIYEKISKFFDNKVLPRLDDSLIESIIKEGKIRYSNKVPPSYEDDKKENNQYGDLIIWKEIISRAKENKKNVIFISNDEKEDWVYILSDKKKIGVRLELIEEIGKEAQVSFHIANFKNFIISISKTFGLEVDKKQLNESLKFESNFILNKVYLSTGAHLIPFSGFDEATNNMIQAYQTERSFMQSEIKRILQKNEISDDEQQQLNKYRERIESINNDLGAYLDKVHYK